MRSPGIEPGSKPFSFFSFQSKGSKRDLNHFPLK